MKRTIYSLFAAVLCCTTLSAQATFGVRVGYNSTDAKIEAGDIEIDTEGEGNLMLGIFANLPLGTNIVSIQPEINYQNRGYAINADNITLGSQTISYLDLGALARLNFNMDGPVGIYIGAGPYITYAVSGSVDNGIDGERDIDFDADRIKRRWSSGCRYRWRDLRRRWL